jgi:YVTN family beta-propeller protein/VCBS repeat-containing protein
MSSSGTPKVHENSATKVKPLKPKKAPPRARVGVAETSTASPPAQQPRASGETAAKKAAVVAPKVSANAVAPAPVSVAATTAPAVLAPAAIRVAVPVSAPATIATLVTRLLAPVLSAIDGVLPKGPVESPLAWLVLAATRRQTGEATAQATVQRVATSQTLAAAVVNLPPTATPTVQSIDAITGAVTGQLVGTDPEGKKVTYALTTKPVTGTLVFDTTTAKYTYTPTASQRLTAAVTPAMDTIGMTVTVSDGTTKVPVVVDIPISAAPISQRATITGVSGAGAVAASNTRVYVANTTAGTVTVIDTATGAVVNTITVGFPPDGLALKPDGTRLYASSSTGNGVAVIDTASGTVKATIAVAKPTAMTVNPSGSTLYVANVDSGVVTKISTSTNKVSGTVKLPAGLRPDGIAVSPDSSKVYVTSGNAAGGTTVSVFAASASTTTAVADLNGAATALAVSPDDAKLYVGTSDGIVTVFDTKTKAVLHAFDVGSVPAGVSTSTDGTVLVVTDTEGAVVALDAANDAVLQTLSTRSAGSPLSQAPGVAVSPDRTQAFISDIDGGTVHVVSFIPPNAPPQVGTPTTGVANATTGALAGTVGVTDPNLDRLTYAVTAAPAKGKVVVNADGTFSYTPTAAARHAAAAVGAPAGDTADSFAVTVSDGRGGAVTATVTVDVLPANKLPTATKTVGTPNATTGIVTGSVKGADADKDALTYALTGSPTKGGVVVNASGTFTYTPTAEARHAAMKIGATAADKQDTFTVSVSDGHGGVTPVTLTVAISPKNTAPVSATYTNAHIGLNSGIVTATITAVDADGDALTVTSTAAKKGTLVLGSDGSFTYTPTAAARLAASAANASAATKVDTITFTVSDGYGGTTKVAVPIPIAPNGHVDVAPTNPRFVTADPTDAIGTVVGRVGADDADGDTLTYTVTTAATQGLVTIDPTSGGFWYTPNVDARYRAAVTPGPDTDTFTVSITDGYGGSTAEMVTVPVAPPAANAVDQRSTAVGVSSGDMYFYTQDQLDDAFTKLQAQGIDQVRILLPWAGIEPQNGVYDWTAVDRMVDTATARGITVLGVLNNTPDWAAVPGQPPLSGSPANLQQFGDFVTAVATHLAGKVADYEVWNEPNYDVFWSPEPDATQYTALLKVAYVAIKTADPNAMVIAGAVGSTIDHLDANGQVITVNPVEFVYDMYLAGARGYFDAISFHPYDFTVPFSQGDEYYEDPLSQAERIHDLMVQVGDGNKKIWATEYGEPSAIAGEDQQAAYLGDFLRTWRGLDYAGPAFLHTYEDSSNPDPNEASYGLFHQDGTPKPAIVTVAQVIEENEAIEAAENVDL